MLENLNGLVLAGEVSLETLQQALKNRVSEANRPFSNHFELAAFLYDRAKDAFRDRATEPLVGRVDILYSFLNEVNLNKPSAVEIRVDNLNANQENETIAQRLIDDILSERPDQSDVYLRIKREAGERNPYSTPADVEENPNLLALGKFMKRWGDLEGTFHAIGKKQGDSYGPRWNYGEMRRIAKEILGPDGITDLELLLRLRSEVVHGNNPIGNESLTTAAKTAEHIMELVTTRLPSV